MELQDSPGRPLQGVVAYLGEVSFSEGTDWVGVRLTGASVGMGKNDGSVRGVRYFDNCGTNGGVFVRRAAVTKRNLTRLEELRLKRELNKAGVTLRGPGTGAAAAGASPTVTARSRATPAGTAVAESNTSATPVSGAHRSRLTPPKISAVGLSAAKATPSSLPTPTTSSASASSALGKSRIDEIRERRAALAAVKDVISSGTTTPPSEATDKPTTGQDESSRPAALLEQVASLSRKLRAKEEENASLQQALSKAEQDAHDANTLASKAKSDVAALKAELERASSSTTPSKLPSSSSPSDGTEEQLQQALEETRALQSQLHELTTTNESLEQRLNKALQDLSHTQEELDQERESRSSQIAKLEHDSMESRGRITALERDVATHEERAAARSASDMGHYKERAKLEGEVSALRRRVRELESEKVEYDTAIEELTLDKEQLQEEKEALEDKLEEWKIDAESAQIEMEELRVELEEARERAASAEERAARIAGGNSGASAPGMAADAGAGPSPTPLAGGGGGGSSGTGADADDVARALSTQNTRLREALLRLREQSNMEKMELTKKLRSAEKDAASGRALMDEVAKLRSRRDTLETEIRDLKEMVDQNSAFENMVEDLSDRVLAFEDEIAMLRGTIRELEEAADIAAEMEEVQADENRALMKDLESRDTAIRNLEEAIKMQRRREEDFQRTVGNYRKSIEKLRQEKAALLALREGGEGEKSDLIAKSQKALAQAAQLVSDAAAMRKREAQASFDRVEAQINGHLSERLESLLPRHVVASEIAAVKGELLLSKVASKASLSLEGLSTIFAKTVQKAMSEVSSSPLFKDQNVKGNNALHLPDGASQRIATMFHQTKFAHIALDAAAKTSKILLAGQWPDLLSADASMELGGTVVHAVSDLDVVLSAQLRMLKEEGALSPHRSNLADLERSVRDASLALSTASDSSGNPLVPPEWKPPACEVFRDVSMSKFSCFGAAAAVASAMSSDETEVSSVETSESLAVALTGLLSKLDKICSETTKACHVLTGLNVSDEEMVSRAGELAVEWRKSSNELFGLVKTLLSGSEMPSASVVKCESKADQTLRCILKMSSFLRSCKIVGEEGRAHHSLSPETDDAWEGIVRVVRKVRVLDGDDEDLNFFVRARSIMQKLAEAVDSMPKLSLANAKVTSLEKSLSSRSKEIAIQNARLRELENLLAQTSSHPSPNKPLHVDSSAEELSTLKEENRVLTEAMDVLHKQVDEYEQEIRALKDSKLRTPGRRSLQTPRRASSLDIDFSVSKLGREGGADMAAASSVAKAAALEAALFRPALRSARLDAALWKSKAIGSSLMNLPALFVPGASPAVVSGTNHQEAEPNRTDDAQRVLDDAFRASNSKAVLEPGDLLTCLQELSIAQSNMRLTKASVSVVDLTRGGEGKAMTVKAQLREECSRKEAAINRLEEATSATRSWLAKYSGFNDVGGAWLSPSERSAPADIKMFGKVSVPGAGKKRVVPLIVQKSELNMLHMYLLQ